MGKRVTFEVEFTTEAERAAYIAGYNDAIDTAITMLRGTASVLENETAKAVLNGAADALEESGKVA